MKTNHTPTPWVQNKIFGKPAFNIRSGQTSIAMVYENIGSNVLNDRDGEGKANAQFIVKAVNHHAELIAALEAVMRLPALDVVIGPSPAMTVLDNARTILAKLNQ